MNGPDFQYDGLKAFAPVTYPATAKKAGLMSAADKAKLDSLSGGGSVATGTLASRPATGAVGALYLPTDAPYLYEGNGTTWDAWGPLRQLTPPALAAFSWVNQGTATVDTSHGNLILTTPANTTDNWRILEQATPAAPWTLTAMLRPLLFNINFMGAGLTLRNSATGAFHAWVYNQTGGLYWQYYNSPTSFNATPTIVDQYPRCPLWLRVRDDGVNLVGSFSEDGWTWATPSILSRGAFTIPDRVGFAVNTKNATFACTLSVLSWTLG